MKIQLECIPCSLNSYLRLVRTGVIPEDQEEEIFRRMLTLFAAIDFDQSPPVLGCKMHALIRESLHDPDPYHRIKAAYNQMVMDLYPELEKKVHGSENPFDTAMRLAIAGNVIDFGARYQLDIMGTIDRIMDAKLAVDHSLRLKVDLEQAETLMYIGDNCGEIVLDKLFLSVLDVPVKYFVVRDSPIINDVTYEDAILTGIDKVATVISTGDNSPGAVWESTSKQFQHIFRTADVIISKGQGNLEGLLDVPHKSIYFLLVTKCDLMAERVGVRKKEFIVKKGKKVLQHAK
jgi:uncharacterized protein with ATP-grasp and redox domains